VQYYNLIHLGFAGYREIVENCLANARILSQSLEATGWFTCVSEIHHRREPASGSNGEQEETSALYQPGLPVVSFRLSNDFKKSYPRISQETISLLLRARQWIVPNYALPPDEHETEILRCVIRVNMSFDLLDRLVADIVQVTESLMRREEEGEKEKGKVDVLGLLREQHLRRKPPVKKRVAEKAIEEMKARVEARKRRKKEGIHRTVC
jgi:glutamate decarboxylase